MAAERREHSRASEVGGETITLDPLYFIKDPNLALATTNLGKALDGPFSLKLYQKRGPIEIVDVLNPLTEEIEHRIRNGHNRTAAAIDAKRKGELPPDAKLEFLNTTGDVKQRRFPGHEERNYLTDEEYYILLGDEAKTKEELAFRRMASHLFTDWRRWVGDNVAQEFPALAALHILSRDVYSMQSQNEVYVRNAIDLSKTGIMGGEDEEKREKLKEGLKAMATRVIASGLSYRAVRFAGFELVTAGYEDIGEETRRHEILGLLALQDISGKVADEEQRAELGRRLIATFEGIKKPGAKGTDIRTEDVRAIINALTAQNFDYADLFSFFDPVRREKLKVRYNKIKDRKDRERYKALHSASGRDRTQKSQPDRSQLGAPVGGAIVDVTKLERGDDGVEGDDQDPTQRERELREEIASKDREIGQLRGAVAEQAGIITAQEQQNEQLRTQAERLSGERDKARTQATEKDQTIRQLRATVRDQDTTINTQGQTIVDLTAQNQRLKEEATHPTTSGEVELITDADLQAKIAELERQRAWYYVVPLTPVQQKVAEAISNGTEAELLKTISRTRLRDIFEGALEAKANYYSSQEAAGENLQQPS